MSDSVRPHRRQPTRLPAPGILQARTLEWVAISFSNAWKWKVKVKSLSRVRLLATPQTAAHQAPPSMGFSRQEYWSRVPLDAIGDSTQDLRQGPFHGTHGSAACFLVPSTWLAFSQHAGTHPDFPSLLDAQRSGTKHGDAICRSLHPDSPCLIFPLSLTLALGLPVFDKHLCF